MLSLKTSLVISISALRLLAPEFTKACSKLDPNSTPPGEVKSENISPLINLFPQPTKDPHNAMTAHSPRDHPRLRTKNTDYLHNIFGESSICLHQHAYITSPHLLINKFKKEVSTHARAPVRTGNLSDREMLSPSIC